jgi:peptidoglycan/xylan/chitin deacetylase (PgdA/CDA1 family)
MPAAALRSVPRRRPTALMYHGFSVGPAAHDPYDLIVSEDALRAQLQHLRTTGWRAVDLDGYLDALSNGRTDRRTYLVTIDDAFRSVLTVGAPVLAELGVPSVLFAPAGLLGGTSTWLEQQPDEPILTPDELRTVAGMGVEIGVHGWDHASMAGMSDADLQRSTVGASDALADVTGVRPRAFAYPYGDYDARATAAVAAAGFDVGFSVYADAGRHAISRTDVKPRDSLTTLKVKLAFGARYRQAWKVAGLAGPVRRALRASSQKV